MSISLMEMPIMADFSVTVYVINTLFPRNLFN